MKKMTINQGTSAVLASLALLAAGSAQALESGSTPAYPNGSESFLMGAVPPPGFYSLLYVSSYSASRLNDSQGNNLNVPGFRIRANAIAARFAWVPGVKVGDGDLVFHTIVPLLNISARTPGGSQTRTGVGDVTVGGAVGFHHSPNFHTAFGVDWHLDTGSWSQSNIVNLGNNHKAVEPIFAFSYIDPKGLNADMRIGYSFNQKNKATDYRSGDDFHFDYSVGWGLGPKWVLGVGGYYYQQVKNDRQGGVELASSKTRAMSIGPALKYDSGTGWIFTVKWEKEFAVRNKTQGSALQIKAILPF